MATIKDIAKKAGVSVSTVSLVLNGKSQAIRKETIDRVLAVIKEEHYQPNAVARSLITKKSKTIGVLLPDSSIPLFSDIIKGIDSYVFENDYSLLLCNTKMKEDREHHYIRLLLSKQIDGLIIFSAVSNREQIADIFVGVNIPVVYFNPAESNHDIISVGTDDFMGGYLAGKYLLECGHRELGVITGEQIQQGDVNKLNGFLAALKEFDCTLEEKMFFKGDYSLNSGEEGAQKLIHNNAKALFVFGNLMACGVYKFCAKNKIEIPKDLSILGYGDIFTSEILPVPLTTIFQPTYEIGYELGKTLLQLINKSTEPIISKSFTPTIIERSSVLKLTTTNSNTAHETLQLSR